MEHYRYPRDLCCNIWPTHRRSPIDAFTGEAYEALVAFLDENNTSWRESLKRYMTKAVRGDGKASRNIKTRIFWAQERAAGRRTLTYYM